MGQSSFTNLCVVTNLVKLVWVLLGMIYKYSRSAVDRGFVHLVFDPDGPPGSPWGLHGAPMGAPWCPMGITWAPHGTPQGPRTKNTDVPKDFV